MVPQLPQTMRAIQWTTITSGLENSLILNPSAPLPKTASSLPAGSTLVRVAYTTINPVDFKVPETLLARTFAISKPAIPCVDFSGTVVATANPALKEGDRVFGKTEPPVFGAMGEYLVVAEQGCVKVPEGANLKEAAGLGVCGLTAYQTLIPFLPNKTDDAQPKILINGGSGGVGTYTIQLAKIHGCHVTTTCSGPNISLCQSLGADEVLDYRSVDIVSELKRRGTQFDLIIDNVNVGFSPLYQQAHHYLKPSRPYITIAGEPSLGGLLGIAQMFLLPSFLGGGQRSPKFVMCTSKKDEYAQLGQWMGEGKLRTVVDEEFGLEEAGKAFGRSKTGRVRGKVLVRVCGEE